MRYGIWSAAAGGWGIRAGGELRAGDKYRVFAGVATWRTVDNEIRTIRTDMPELPASTDEAVETGSGR